MEQVKNIIYISIIVAILGFGAFSLYETYIATDSSSSLGYTTEKISTDSNLDSDNDGLKDWEEILWRTNPFITDSDGDGTNDGDEVALGRDPSIRGPADSTQTESRENSTNKIAEDLISSYLETDGKSFVDTDKFISDILKNTYIATQTTIYTSADIQISSNSISDIRTYGNNTARALRTAQQQNELVVFATALDNNDEFKIRELDPIIKNYRETLSSLLTIPTPPEFEVRHLALINSMNKVIANIEGMRLLFSDTTTAVSSVSTYQTDLNQFILNLKNLATKISKKGIEYSTDESGYGLLNIL